MKKMVLLLLACCQLSMLAQDRLSTTKGTTAFEASIPMFEEVKALNTKTSCALLTKSGGINCWMNIKDFNFPRALMQQHFNENYMKSNRFPRAFFKGSIEKFDLEKCSNTPQNYIVSGKLTIKGITKKISIPASIKKTSEGLSFQANFAVNTDDYNIEIPLLVRSKISKKVNTSLYFVLQ
ncbi:MAG: YceI family protein [Flavobacterium sp.]